MTLKGAYSGETSYSVGDAVQWTDGTFFILRKPCKSGVPPTMTEFWERMPKWLAEAAKFCMDAVSMAISGALTGKVANNLTTTTSGKVLDARQGKALKDLIDPIGTAVSGLDTSLKGLNPDGKTIRLASSTAESAKIFNITVDDDGELTATEYTPPAAT